MTNANIDTGWGHEHRRAEYGVEDSYFVLYISHSMDFHAGTQGRMHRAGTEPAHLFRNSSELHMYFGPGNCKIEELLQLKCIYNNYQFIDDTIRGHKTSWRH